VKAEPVRLGPGRDRLDRDPADRLRWIELEARRDVGIAPHARVAGHDSALVILVQAAEPGRARFFSLFFRVPESRAKTSTVIGALALKASTESMPAKPSLVMPEHPASRHEGVVGVDRQRDGSPLAGEGRNGDRGVAVPAGRPEHRFARDELRIAFLGEPLDPDIGGLALLPRRTLPAWLTKTEEEIGCVLVRSW
jgi:hypothetical protein